MFKKRKLIPILLIIIIGIAGFVRINIINTKALSPIGNTEDNYALVSAEFGEDFKKFIKDNAEVKIYSGEGEDNSTIKVNEKEFRLKKENPFFIVAATVGTKIKDGFVSVKEKIDSKISDINSNNNNNNLKKDDANNDLDATVEDFIKKRDESTNKTNLEEEPINNGHNSTGN